MKITWKIFFVFTAFITIIFSVFGVWMISASFNNSYERMIDEGSRENKMLRLTFEVNLNAFSQEEIDDETVSEISESIVDNMEQKGYSYKVYREGQSLYESSSLKLDNNIRDMLTENINSGYETIQIEDKVYVIFLCRSECNERTYYLETVKDITEIYSKRDSFYYQYCIAIAVLLVCTCLIVLVLSHMLTKSVVELSNTTREFAGGNYEVRANIKAGDEIGRLASDFNSMADCLAVKMDELMWEARKQEDFSASFAHELKTPLTSIIGYAEMLRTMELDREETMEAADYIYSEGKRLESLSRKLLNLVGLDRHSYNFNKVSVRKLMEEAERVTADMLERKCISYEMYFEDGYIYGEFDLLVSLLVNLIDNARKAVSEKGSIVVSGEKVPEGYKLSIKDNGRGIPENEINKITEAFYMVDKSRARREGSAGLGLSLCNKIVYVHNADWTINSREGEGTEVIVVFQGPDEKKGGDISNEKA